MTKTQLTVFVGALAVVWAVLLLYNGVAVTVDMLKPFSAVVGIGLTLLQLFDKYVWRWSALHPWLVNRPVAHGTWQGELVSDWVNPETGAKVAPKVAYFRVKQTLSTIHLRLMTAESKSELVGGQVMKREDDTFAIVGVYLNEPKAEFLHRSPVHHGGILLNIQSDPPARLEGNYWTARKTVGRLTFTKRIPTLCDSFEGAESVFRQAATPLAPA